MYMKWLKPFLDIEIEQLSQEYDVEFEEDYKKFVEILDHLKSLYGSDIAKELFALESLYNGTQNKIVERTYMRAFTCGVEATKAFYK